MVAAIVHTCPLDQCRRHCAHDGGANAGARHERALHPTLVLTGSVQYSLRWVLTSRSGVQTCSLSEPCLPGGGCCSASQV